MSEIRICTSSAICEAHDYCAHARPHDDEQMLETCNSHPCKVRSEMVLCLPVQKCQHLLTAEQRKALGL